MNLNSFVDELMKIGAPQAMLRPAKAGTSLVLGTLRRLMSKRAGSMGDVPFISADPVPFAQLVNPVDQATRLPAVAGKAGAIVPGTLGTIETPKQYIDEKKHNRAWEYAR